jgi:hypothetical protein
MDVESFRTSISLEGVTLMRNYDVIFDLLNGGSTGGKSMTFMILEPKPGSDISTNTYVKHLEY